MNSFEKGRRRVPVSLLRVIAQTLDTTLDALVNDEAHNSCRAEEAGAAEEDSATDEADRDAAHRQAAHHRASDRLDPAEQRISKKPAQSAGFLFHSDGFRYADVGLQRSLEIVNSLNFSLSHTPRSNIN